jgi:hypothetical protein
MKKSLVFSLFLTLLLFGCGSGGGESGYEGRWRIVELTPDTSDNVCGIDLHGISGEHHISKGDSTLYSLLAEDGRIFTGEESEDANGEPFLSFRNDVDSITYSEVTDDEASVRIFREKIVVNLGGSFTCLKGWNGRAIKVE